MKPAFQDLSEQVWRRTLPALRQRRACRRAVGVGAGAALLLLALFAVGLWSADRPAEDHQVTTPAPSHPVPAESSSLAVLVIDQAGVHFQELAPEELAGAGLDFQLTLEPLFTGPVHGIY